MTMTTNDRQAEILARVRDDFLESMPAHFERLRWIQGQLIEFQTQRLRALLGVAIDASPFHRPRLTGVDPNTFTLSDLGSLPVMTKTEMMAAYDDVVTDPRLNLEAVNRHVEALGDQPLLHLDRYVVLASGGSSGVRGVYACDLTGAAQHTAAVIRGGLAGLAATIGWPPPGPAPTAIVAAPSCVHATRSRRRYSFKIASATLPLPRSRCRSPRSSNECNKPNPCSSSAIHRLLLAWPTPKPKRLRPRHHRVRRHQRPSDSGRSLG